MTFHLALEIMKAKDVCELAKLQNRVEEGECCVCKMQDQHNNRCSCCSQVRSDKIVGLTNIVIEDVYFFIFIITQTK